MNVPKLMGNTEMGKINALRNSTLYYAQIRYISIHQIEKKTKLRF